MHILFLTHYFPPEVNAPASRTYEHCVRWARSGNDVTVVTGVPNCPDGIVFGGYRNRFRPQVEQIDGIRVVRAWTYLAPNAGSVRRILNYVSYLFSAVLASLWLPRPDVVIATSPQFFCGWAGVWTARLKRCAFVLEVRDIWPESIEVVGAFRNRRLLRFLEWLERRLYRAADHIVTVGNGYRERLLSKFDHPKQISVVTNGVDLERFVPVDGDAEFLKRWNLEGKFVCSYVGTIGMAHGLDVVLEAARLLREDGRDDIRFLLVGDGAERAHLQERSRGAGLNDLVIFTGRLSKEEMPRVLAASDACLVHLRKCELFESVIPSKLFEIMAMRRPIIMGVHGEALDMVLEAGAGIEMEPDSAHSLVACVEKLADTPGLTDELGRTAREYVAARFSRDTLAAQYLRLLEQVARKEPAERVEPVVDAPLAEVSQA